MSGLLADGRAIFYIGEIPPNAGGCGRVPVSKETGRRIRFEALPALSLLRPADFFLFGTSALS